MDSLSVQEGANINKSLTTLGKVISALADMVGSSLSTGSTGAAETGSQRVADCLCVTDCVTARLCLTD